MSKTISRREAVRIGLLGAGGLLLTDRLALRAPAAPEPAPAPAKAKAKSVIFVWLEGGLPHLDTFDPKADAGADITGGPPFDKAIRTNVPGIMINGMLPVLARQADKYSIIRSVTHAYNGHEFAGYTMLTGRDKGGMIFPSFGWVVSLLKGVDAGYRGRIPPYVVLTRESRPELGFLDPRYGPFCTGGDPSQTPFAVEGIVAPGVTEEQQHRRRELLHKLDTLGGSVKDGAQSTAWAQTEEAAYDLVLGEGRKLFDLSEEKELLTKRAKEYSAKGDEASAYAQAYRGSRFGLTCIMARRLVEAGVPFVQINAAGFDTHGTHDTAYRQSLMPFDVGLAGLLQDLSERGLLETTVVYCCGEFGHHPRGGHWPNAFSALVAGGGFKGGHVVGATDARGEYVKDRPVYPVDLLGSIYQLLGIDLATRLPHPRGDEVDVRVMPSAADNVKSAGLLKEIMS
ncbi:MAG: DUF1501 domain-containing protein [Thermoguttaceae bacterium]|jgi:uncharacterized protein (DUF1501 family)